MRRALATGLRFIFAEGAFAGNEGRHFRLGLIDQCRQGLTVTRFRVGVPMPQHTPAQARQRIVVAAFAPRAAARAEQLAVGDGGGELAHGFESRVVLPAIPGANVLLKLGRHTDVDRRKCPIVISTFTAHQPASAVPIDGTK